MPATKLPKPRKANPTGARPLLPQPFHLARGGTSPSAGERIGEERIGEEPPCVEPPL